METDRISFACQPIKTRPSQIPPIKKNKRPINQIILHKGKKTLFYKSDDYNLKYNPEDKLDRFLMANNNNLKLIPYIAKNSRNILTNNNQKLSLIVKPISDSDSEKHEIEYLKFQEDKALNILIKGFCENFKSSNKNLNHYKIKIDNNLNYNLSNCISNYGEKAIRKFTGTSVSKSINLNSHFHRNNVSKRPKNKNSIENDDYKTKNLKNLILQETFSKINQNIAVNYPVEFKEMSLEEPICNSFNIQKKIVKNIKKFRENIKKPISLKKIQK